MPVLELDPRDRIPQLDEGRFTFVLKILGIVGAVIIAVGLFGVGGFYWYQLSQRPSYEDVYAQLGMSSLPKNIGAQPEIKNRLDQLGREPCYREAIYGLADALLDAGYPRDANTSLVRFGERCGNSDELLMRRYKALYEAICADMYDVIVASFKVSAGATHWRL
jgi:hypothetical protein